MREADQDDGRLVRVVLRDLQFGNILVLGIRIHRFLQIEESLVHILLPGIFDGDAGRTGTDHGRNLRHIALTYCHRFDVLDELLLYLLRRTLACLQLDKEPGIIQVGQQVDSQLVVGYLAQQQDRQYEHADSDRVAYCKFDNAFHNALLLYFYLRILLQRLEAFHH